MQRRSNPKEWTRILLPIGPTGNGQQEGRDKTPQPGQRPARCKRRLWAALQSSGQAGLGCPPSSQPPHSPVSQRQPEPATHPRLSSLSLASTHPLTCEPTVHRYPWCSLSSASHPELGLRAPCQRPWPSRIWRHRAGWPCPARCGPTGSPVQGASAALAPPQCPPWQLSSADSIAVGGLLPASRVRFTGPIVSPCLGTSHRY